VDRKGTTDVGESAAEFFGGMGHEYDSLIHRAVPGYAVLTEALLAELPLEAADLLELGCGTGNLSLRLAERYPGATATFVDASPEMVETTRRRLQAAAPTFAGRARFVVARFEELELDGRVDLITSMLALHHVADLGPLYHRMHGHLLPAGRFCFADQLRMARDTAQARQWEEMVAFWKLPAHCSPAEVVALQEHSDRHDHYITLGQQFALLRAAGFRDVDAPWRHGMWTVLDAVA
jgi:ubiquinone/menaquinone biosynthesis C-methylase UbiE